MPRQLKFYLKKSNRISQVAKRPQGAYHIHVPITAYKTAPVRSLEHLSQRLDTLPTLTVGWREHTEARETGNLLFTSLANNSSTTTLTTLAVIVDRNFHWHVQYNGYTLDCDNCQALQSIPKTINCVQHVSDLLRLIKSVKVCSGNEASAYSSVPSRWSS